MPLYEYKCDSCGSVFEVMQKFSDTPLEVHEGCGGRVERLISPPAFHFKGSGWYVTDYGRRGGNGSGGSKPHDTAPKSEPSSASKSETKTETKSEAKPAAEAKK